MTTKQLISQASRDPTPPSSSSSWKKTKSFLPKSIFSSSNKLKRAVASRSEDVQREEPSTSPQDTRIQQSDSVSKATVQSPKRKSTRSSKKTPVTGLSAGENATLNDSAATTVAMETSSSSSSDAEGQEIPNRPIFLVGLSMADEESELDRAHRLVQQGLADFFQHRESSSRRHRIDLEPFTKALWTLETYLGTSHELVAQLYHWIGYILFHNYLQEDPEDDHDRDELLTKALAALQKSLRIGLSNGPSNSSSTGVPSSAKTTAYGSYSIQETQATISDVLLEQGHPQVKVDHQLHSFKESIILEREGDMCLARKNYEQALATYELSLHVYFDQWHFRILEKVGSCHFSINRQTRNNRLRNHHLDEAFVWYRKSLQAMVEPSDGISIGSYCRQQNERARIMTSLQNVMKCYPADNGKRLYDDETIRVYMKNLRHSILSEKEAKSLLQESQNLHMYGLFELNSLSNDSISSGVSLRAQEKFQEALDKEACVLDPHHPVILNLLKQIALLRVFDGKSESLKVKESSISVQKLEQELKAWKICAKSWEFQCKTLASSAEDVERKTKEQRKELRIVKRNSIEQKDSLESARERIALLQTECGELNEKLNELVAIEQKYDSEEVSRLSSKLSKVKASRKSISSELTNLQLKHAELQQGTMTTQNEVEELRSTLSEYSAREAAKDDEIHEWKTKFESLWNESAKHFQQLSKELSEKDDQIAGLSSEVAKLTSEEFLGHRVKTLESMLRDLRGRRLMLLDKNKSLRMEVATLKAEQVRLDNNVKQEVASWIRALQAKAEYRDRLIENLHIGEGEEVAVHRGNENLHKSTQIEDRLLGVEEHMKLAMNGAEERIESMSDSIGCFKEEINKSLLVLHHAAKKNIETLSARNIIIKNPPSLSSRTPTAEEALDCTDSDALEQGTTDTKTSVVCPLQADPSEHDPAWELSWKRI